MKMNINTDVVFGSDGMVNLDATLSAFEVSLSKLASETETQLTSIATAVSAVFDKHLGQRMTLPALCSYTVAELNGQPMNWTVLTERVTDYVHAQAKLGVLSIAKGKGGGVARTADLPAKTA